jgi:uncharacterized membrane protein
MPPFSLYRTLLRRVVAGLAVAIFVLSSAVFHSRLAGTLPGREDVRYAWLEGQRLAEGTNPYARILSGDMLTNQSYATYLPVYYLLAAGAYRLGVVDYSRWMMFWRPVTEISHLLIALLLLFYFYRRDSLALGLFASGFWYFNRWSLAVVSMAHLDLPALLLFLGSLLIYQTKRTYSLLLFGLSLAIKQMALLMIPFFLVWEYFQGERKDAWRRTVKAALTLGAIPAAVSLPFLIWNPLAFVKSILFSGTRAFGGDLPVKSLDAILGLRGIVARMPMLGLLVLLLVSSRNRAENRYVVALLMMALFLDYNAIVFTQYMIWVVPFLPLALAKMPEDAPVT